METPLMSIKAVTEVMVWCEPLGVVILCKLYKLAIYNLAFIHKDLNFLLTSSLLSFAGARIESCNEH